MFADCQSGFILGDSCISQLLSITQEIHKSFDCNPPEHIRGEFLDISKAFDKVWHEGLIFKLKTYGVEGKLIMLLENYLKNRNQRVVLNGLNFSWKKILAGVPPESVLRPLLFLIYLNNLLHDISSVCKMFADDASLFSKVKDYSLSLSDLNYDLEKINKWALQWKMSFNPDPNKQATEVLFSHKANSNDHLKLTFNGNQVQRCSSQQHVGLILNNKLDFNKYLDEKINKCNKIIGMIKKLSTSVSRQSLLTIYKSFVRPMLDYGDIIYDKPHKGSFIEKIERVQYNACLVITGSFKGTSRERLYQELGLGSLKDRRWHRKMCRFFYKIVKGLSPKYLISYLQLHNNPIYQTRSTAKNNVKLTASRTVNFNNSFFPLRFQEWNNLSDDIKSLPSQYHLKLGSSRLPKILFLQFMTIMALNHSLA